MERWGKANIDFQVSEEQRSCDYLKEQFKNVQIKDLNFHL